ncbi:hypothetical protein A2U01_0119580, partial [Trifolium medium]|nr:hypothetical protein [Trifolium medium]
KSGSVEKLGKSDANPTVDDTPIVEASTKADVNSTAEVVQKTGSETLAEQDVTPSGQTSDKPDDVPNA